jgi:glycosyltransferase involved in cell wall biosynthesis
MMVSLVMATYRHAPYLKNTLHSIFTQTRLPDQIIIVEDGEDCDSGSTSVVINTWKTLLPIEHYRRRNRPNLLYSNQAVCLNAAFKKATGDILLIHDDACLFTSNNDIENLIQPVEEDPDITTYAVLKNLDRNGQNPGIEWVDAEGKPTFFNYRGQAIRKDVVMAMGGIEESFIGYGGDDCNFRERLILWDNRRIKTQRLFNVVIHHQWHPSGRHDSELPVYHKNSAQYDKLSDYGKYGLVANVGREWGQLE